MRGATTHVRVLWAGAALLSCRELPPLPAGICGNSVVEPGEDCDRVVDPALGPGTACGDERDGPRACRYTCTDGAPCPAGWACRPDEVCHHGTGEYEEAATTEPWFGDDWWVGDVDGDTVADVVGATGGEVRVLRGDGTGRLDVALKRALPRGTVAALAIGDLEDDGRLDVVVPSPLGLVVLRGDAAQTLQPEVFTPYAISAGSQAAWVIPLRALDLPRHTPVMLSQEPQGIAIVPWTPIGLPSRIEGASLARLSPRPVVGDLDRDGNDELILAFEGGGEVWKCETYVPFGGEELRFGPESVPLGSDPDGEPLQVLDGALLADVDGDGAIDVLVSVRGERVVLLRGDGRGGFDRPELTTLFDSDPGEMGPGWPLASGQLDGSGPDDFVTPAGVWLTDPGDPEDPEDPGPHLVRADEPFPAGARWREAIVLDFDSFGLLDVVVADEEEPGLLVLRGGQDPALRSELPVPSEGLASLLRRGNFDGDAYEDVAFRDGDSGLSVLFGGPAPPEGGARAIHAATIDGLVRVETGALRYPPESRPDRLDDIVVSTAPDAEGTQRGGVFVGAGTRVVESPLALVESINATTPRAAALGTFLAPTAGSPSPQVLVAAGPERSASLWLGRALGPAAELHRIDELPAGFDTGCARWAVGDVDADERDELLGLSGSGCAEGAPAGVRVDLGPPSSVTVEEIGGPPAPGLRMVLLADLDGDGAADLVRAGAAGVELVWSDGAGIDLTSPTLLAVAPDGAAPVTALPLRADADATVPLAVATTGSIWLAEVAPDRTITWRTERIARFGSNRLGAGDIDRDGLLDLVAGDSTALRVLRARSHLPESP